MKIIPYILFCILLFPHIPSSSADNNNDDELWVWISEIIPEENDIFDFEIVNDDNGTPHISYITENRNGTLSLKYAVKVSGTWEKHFLSRVYEICRPSLAIDSVGNVHITHYSFDGLLYYRLLDDTWKK